MTNEQILKSTLAGVLTNVLNYPEDVQARLLGADMSKVIDEAVATVLAAGVVERLDALHFRPDVDRVELIVNSERVKVIYGATAVETALQDEGRTLKIFLKEGPDGS